MNTPQLNNKVSNRVEATKKKARKVVRSWKFKLLAVLLGLVGTLVVLDLACRNITEFTNTHKITRQPILRIKIQWPYRIEGKDSGKKVIPPLNRAKNSPILDVDVKVRADYEKAYNLVWLNESGKGTNKNGLNGYCLSKNMINEIGFAPHENYCFKDRTEQKETFYLWLDNRLNHKKMPWCDEISECILNYTNNSYTL
jgi:hypothetical protein